MLGALLLLGLLPLASMPMLQAASGYLDSADDTAPDAPQTDGAQDLLDDGPEEDAEAQAVGDLYELDATPGETVFDGFAPGEDIVEVDLSTLTDDLVFEETGAPEGAAVSFAVGDEAALTLRFPGLSEVPGDDIEMLLADADGGTFQMSLAELRLAAEAEFDPVDPDAPETAVEGVAADGLDPVDPDLPDAPGPGDVGPGLDPVDPDLPDAPGDPDVGPGLDPIPPGDEVLGPEGDLALRDLIERDSDAVHGLGAALAEAQSSGTVDTLLDAADDSQALADDGVAGTGAGSIGLAEGTPVVSSDAPIEVVDGADGDDSLTGGDAASFLFGGAGDDVLTAGEGAAAMFGGAGADALDGTIGGPGFIDGGTGDDTLTGGIGDDTLEGGEHAGGAGGNDLIAGGGGDDLIRGGFGSDTLQGGDGDDVIDHLGHAEEREIAENHEFDWHLDGEADVLTGGAGDDTLIMDGADVAEGGDGADLFWVYSDASEVAEILDFRVGEDFLRLSLDPQTMPLGEAAVEVVPSADGADALVSVDGTLIAILRGAAGATASDVYAAAEADVFPAGP